MTFIFFLIIPVYLDPSQTIQFKPGLPAITPIGHDFRAIVNSSSTWLHTWTVPPILYPPLTLLVFAPFTFFSLDTGYKIMLLMILICFIITTVVLPQAINQTLELSPLSVLILITGLGSYGLEFELERGQWNIVAFTLCLAAIFLFHRRPKERWLAYVLFSLSVQLKLYPAIWVFVLIDDWADWKKNIRRIIGLGLVNLLALFILGLQPILTTLGGLGGSNLINLGLGTPYNHSIASFIYSIQTSDFMHNLFLHKEGKSWLNFLGWIAPLFLIALFILFFLIILRQESRKSTKGFNPYVFLACSVGACILPSLSFDYKLSLLPACILVSIPATELFLAGKNRLGSILLSFVFWVAYSSTLYSYTDKPPLLQNDFPALVILLLVTLILSGSRLENTIDPQSSRVPIPTPTVE